MEGWRWLQAMVCKGLEPFADCGSLSPGKGVCPLHVWTEARPGSPKALVTVMAQAVWQQWA